MIVSIIFFLGKSAKTFAFHDKQEPLYLLNKDVRALLTTSRRFRAILPQLLRNENSELSFLLRMTQSSRLNISTFIDQTLAQVGHTITSLDLKKLSITVKKSPPSCESCFAALFKKWKPFQADTLTCAKLVTYFPKLQRLDLSDCDLEDEDLEEVSKLQDLRILTISGNRKISDKGVVHLPKLTELWSLDIGMNFKLNERGFSAIARISKLVHLSIRKCHLTSEDMQKICSMRALTFLDMSECANIIRDISCILQLINLKVLNFNQTNVDNEDLSVLGRMRNLSTLSLVGCSNVTDLGVANLETCHTLRRLDISGNPQIKERAAHQLYRALPKLKTIFI